MAVRTTMQAIVDELRQYGQAAEDDVFDGVTYWTDAQLQQIADKSGTRGLVKIKRTDPAYLIYQIVAPKQFRVEDTLTIYTNRDADAVVATTFSLNPDTNELTFTAPLGEDTYYAYSFGVDLYEALALLWTAKANQRFNYIDWKAQNNKMSMNMEYQHCVDRAAYYRNKRMRSFGRNGKGAWYF